MIKNRKEHQLGLMNVTRVVHSSVPLFPNPNSSHGAESYGSVIDNYLADCVAENEQVQTIALEFSPETWEKVKAFYAPASAAVAEADYD